MPCVVCHNCGRLSSIVEAKTRSRAVCIRVHDALLLPCLVLYGRRKRIRVGGCTVPFLQPLRLSAFLQLCGNPYPGQALQGTGIPVVVAGAGAVGVGAFDRRTSPTSSCKSPWASFDVSSTSFPCSGSASCICRHLTRRSGIIIPTQRGKSYGTHPPCLCFLLPCRCFLLRRTLSDGIVFYTHPFS